MHYKTIFLITLILIFSVSLLSQSNLMIEFNQKISVVNSSIEKIKIYKKYIKDLYQNREKIIEFNIIAKQFLDLVKKEKREDQLAIAYSDYGVSLSRIGKKIEGLKFLNLAVKISINLHDIDKKIYVYSALFSSFQSNLDLKILFTLASKIKLLYQKKGDILNEARYTAMCARILGSKGNSKKRLKLFQQALRLYKRIDDKPKMVHMFECIGYVNVEMGDYEKAVDILIQGLKLGEKINNIRYSGQICMILGDLFIKRMQYEKAYVFYKKGKKILINYRKGSFLWYINLQLGKISFKLKNYKTALEQYKFALNEQLYSNEDTTDNQILFNYMYIGQTYLKLKKYDLAEKHFKKSLKEGLKGDAIKVIAQSYASFGELFNKQKLYNKSIKSLEKSAIYTNKIKDDLLQMNNYKFLFQNYEMLRNYKNSLKYHKLYFNLERKIYNVENTKNLADIETKYETEKKDLEINNLKKINDIKEREKGLIEKQRRYLWYAIILGIILIVIVFFFLIKKYRLLMLFWKRRNFVGKYKLGDKISSGGMGIIYKALDIQAKGEKKDYAVKVLREEFFEDEEIKKRFKYEGLIIDQLNHKNIVKVLERGENNDIYYIVMEYLNGITLSELLKKEGKLEVSEAVSIIKQIIDALIVIHSKGIIHRDIKPENIMLIKENNNAEWTVKVIDFGLAKTETMTKMTITGMVMGTANYISPEQLIGEPVTISSDIYSLGVLFYEILSGEILFSGKSEKVVFLKILEQEREPIINKRPDISSEVNDIIMSMIGREAKNRPDAEYIMDMIERIEI